MNSQAPLTVELSEVKESFHLILRRALGASTEQVEKVWPLIWNEEELVEANELISLI